MQFYLERIGKLHTFAVWNDFGPFQDKRSQRRILKGGTSKHYKMVGAVFSMTPIEVVF